jgi:hypothetical protein
MPKATSTLDSTLSRRKLITGAVTAAAVVAGAVVSPSSSAAPLVARPSELGLALIAAVREFNAALEADQSDEQANAASDRMRAKMGPLRERIEAQPIASFSALVDRAIFAGFDCPGFDGNALSLVEAVCGLAGVDLEDAMIV